MCKEYYSPLMSSKTGNTEASAFALRFLVPRSRVALFLFPTVSSTCPISMPPSAAQRVGSTPSFVPPSLVPGDDAFFSISDCPLPSMALSASSPA